MKRNLIITLTVCLILIFINNETSAQGFSDRLKNTGKIGFGFVATHLDGFGKTTSAGPGAELFYSFNLTSNVFISTGLGFYKVYDDLFKTAVIDETLFPTIDLKLGYDFLAASSFSPFIYAGANAFHRTDNKNTNIVLGYDGSIFAGAGLRISLSNSLEFFTNADYRYVLTSPAPVKPKYWTAHAGISYSLKPRSNTRERVPYPVDDNELALEDLFMDDTADDNSVNNSSTGDPALDALFNDSNTNNTNENLSDNNQSALDELFGENTTEDNKSSDENDAISLLFADESGPVTPSAGNSEYPDTEVGRLMARVQNLKDDISIRDREIATLQAQVNANEQAIAKFSGSIAGQYAGISNDNTFLNVTAENFKSNYQQALQKHYNKQYKEAIQLFSTLLQVMPNHKLASNCQYWIGESYNAMGKHREAINAFAAVLDYRTSYKYDDALIMNGLIFMKLGNKTSARDNFQQLVSKYPDSEYAPKAMRYLGQL